MSYRGAESLAVLPSNGSAGDRARKEATGEPSARLLITSEPRLHHADAVRRLADIAESRNVPATFLEIGGWPAVEITYTEPTPRRGAPAGLDEESEPLFTALTVTHRITAIAAADRVLNAHRELLPKAAPELSDSAQQIVRSATFTVKGNPPEVQATLRRLKTAQAKRQSQQGALPLGTVAPTRPGTQTTPALLVPGAAVPVQTGRGELEVATTARGENMAIASNDRLAHSSDKGETFTAGATGVFGLNDPSLTRSASGSFYLDVIAIPSGTPAQLNVTGCTNATSRSMDGGASFTLQGYSAQCPMTGTGICFPDQEHIAADTINTATGGNDQIYAVWRNFEPRSGGGGTASCTSFSGTATSSISCSQDNGVNSTERQVIPSAGDFPSVSVGRDGAVYVVTLSGANVLLNRFSSCADGLNPEPGFSVRAATLATTTAGVVACPVPGLDRCNDGNTLSSPTVAADPGKARHLFVSFAENNGEGGERIVALESNDKGLTFQQRHALSDSRSVRRFMPWACSTHGIGWVGWYDRAAASQSGASNDLTGLHPV